MTENAINTKELKKYAQEFANSQLEKDSQSDLQKSIVETASEKIGMSKAEFKDIATLYYLKNYKPDSYVKAQTKAGLLEIVEGI